MVKSTLTEQERADKRRAQARERQRRFHEKNKTNPEYIAKRKLNDQKITKMLKEHPTPKPIRPPPPSPPSSEPAITPPPPQEQPKITKQLALKINGKTVAKYPKLTALEVQDFMRKNPQFCLKNGKTEQIDKKSLEKYAGGIPNFAKVIDGTDNFIGAFVNSKKTINLVKNNKTYKKNGIDVEYQPSRFQTWLEYMFSALRALKRSGNLNDVDVDKIIKDDYDPFYQTFLLKKSIQKNKDANNEEYAVPTWDYYGAKVVEDFGSNSVQDLITNLYRYNTVRNDFVNLPITHNKADNLGFYVPKTGNIRVLKNSHKSSGVGHSAIDYIYPKQASAVIRAYIKNKGLKGGDMLLPNSINDIVVDMMEKVHIKYPPTAKPVSVMRNIDSAIGNWNDIDTEEFVERAKISKHSVATRLHTYRRIQKDFNVDYPLKSTS